MTKHYLITTRYYARKNTMLRSKCLRGTSTLAYNNLVLITPVGSFIVQMPRGYEKLKVGKKEKNLDNCCVK
jgi:hypothetical protein